MGLPPSPWLKLPKLICKHRNEEGGLGFAAYTNAAAGGDWIIQPALENACEIARLLPVHAPLSKPKPAPKPNPNSNPNPNPNPKPSPNLSPPPTPNQLSLEYVSDYVKIAGVQMWHQEFSRVINFFVEQEC